MLSGVASTIMARQSTSHLWCYKSRADITDETIKVVINSGRNGLEAAEQHASKAVVYY